MFCVTPCRSMWYKSINIDEFSLPFHYQYLLMFINSSLTLCQKTIRLEVSFYMESILQNTRQINFLKSL